MSNTTTVYITQIDLPCNMRELDVQVFSTKEKAEEYVISELSSGVFGMRDLIAKEGLHSLKVSCFLSDQEVFSTEQQNWFSIEERELR